MLGERFTRGAVAGASQRGPPLVILENRCVRLRWGRLTMPFRTARLRDRVPRRDGIKDSPVIVAG